MIDIYIYLIWLYKDNRYKSDKIHTLDIELKAKVFFMDKLQRIKETVCK